MEPFEYVRETLSAHYSIGELVRAERLEKGYINISFDIETVQKDKRALYLFRAYRKSTPESKIRFEHALMEELHQGGFHLSPGPITTREGTTYARVSQREGAMQGDAYVAVFNYLPGDDNYSWDRPFCTDEELAGAAEVFALYHNTIYGWQGSGEWEEPRIIDLIPLLENQWRAHTQTADTLPFDVYFMDRLDYLSEVLTNPLNSPARHDYDTLPHLAIHGDYHPGNLKFRGGTVTGLFDFDWARMDSRCFDVALAITYFCSFWNGSRDGELLLHRVEMFLDSYQKAAERMKPLGPLSALELQCLPQMFIASGLYLADWAITDYFMFRPNPEEFSSEARKDSESRSQESDGSGC
jgi:homoserine kinase type II